MKIESIKNVNITILFSTPLNHLLISQKTLLDLLKVGDPEKDLHTFIEAPGLKVLVFPKRQEEIVFEANRILINDKTGDVPEQSSVVGNLQKLIRENIIEENKIAAFGFNYDALAALEEADLRIGDFIGSKISAISDNIKGIGANVMFEKNGVKYTLGTKLVGNGKHKFLVHLNVHFIRELPNFEILKEEIKKQFEEFKNIVQRI